MNVWILAFLAHFLADYPLQGDFLATWKSKSWYILFVHSFIWAAMICFFMSHTGFYLPWKFWFLLIGHFIIDGLKCRIWKSPEDVKLKISGMTAFFIDQILHAGQIAVILFF